MSVGIPVFSSLRRLHLVFMLLALLLVPVLAGAQTVVGKVEFTQGLASAQRGGEGPRFLNKGEALHEGDVISTSARGFALISLSDGTRMTLRPNTTFAVDKFSQAPGQESAVSRLLKGGLRAITGTIGKGNPQAVRLNTSTATIGIRGTSFDTRICDADCAKELRPGQRSKPADNPVVARAALLTGSSVVINSKGQSRVVTEGTPLFNGETVRTSKGAYVVLAFRDQTKITVSGESEFKLEDVQFKGTKSDEGSFVVRLVQGGARAVTGLLGKRTPSAVKFNAATATIGIRGTGFDGRLALDCIGPGNCSQGVFAHTWDGTISLDTAQGSLLIPLGRAGVFNESQKRLTLLDKIPVFFEEEPAPRPDAVDVDFDNLFGVVNVDGAPAGVYVNVRDGHIHFAGSRGGIDLGPGESGFLADGQDRPVRLSRTPSFIADDPIPIPENFDEKTLRLLEVLNPGGGPGGVICDM